MGDVTTAPYPKPSHRPYYHQPGLQRGAHAQAVAMEVIAVAAGARILGGARAVKLDKRERRRARRQLEVDLNNFPGGRCAGRSSPRRAALP